MIESSLGHDKVNQRKTRWEENLAAYLFDLADSGCQLMNRLKRVNVLSCKVGYIVSLQELST